MTLLAPAPVVPGPAARERVDARGVLAAGAAVSGLALLVALGGLVLDDRVITGEAAWVKPAKFAFSLGLYLLTLRWVVGHLPGRRRLLLAASAVTVVALLAELALVDLQVVRGTTSHFNTASTFDGAVFQTMGALIALVFAVAVLLSGLVLRRRGLDAGTAAGLRWGLGVCLLGMAVAGTMIANTGGDDGGGHTVGAPDGGPGLPLLGWSSQHGDLRIGHFVGLHALQVLPLLAWLLATRTALDARTRARLVAVAGRAYAGLVLLLVGQALRGEALLRPDALTLLAATALAAATAAGTARVLRARVSP